jgi:hypothetical protein
MRNAAIDSFFKPLGTVKCSSSSSQTIAVPAGDVSTHSSSSGTAISPDTAAEDQAGRGAADAGTALPNVPSWQQQQQQGIGQQLGQQQQQQQWQQRHRKLKAHAEHHRPARKMGAVVPADAAVAWPNIAAASAAVISGAAVDPLQSAAAVSGWSVGSDASSLVHPGVWDGHSDTWDLDQAYAADQTEEDWDFAFDYDNGNSEIYTGGSSSSSVHQASVVNDGSGVSTSDIGIADTNTTTSHSSSSSSSSAVAAEVADLAACFQPDWVLFIDSGLFFCKSDLQRLLMHKGADLACGWNLQLAKPEPVVVSNTTATAAAVGVEVIPSGDSTAAVAAAAEAAQSAAESAHAAAVAAVARAQVALAAAQEALATAAASGQAAASEAAPEAASTVVSSVSAGVEQPITLTTSPVGAVNSSDNLHKHVVSATTTAMETRQAAPAATIAAPAAEQLAAQLAADAAYYAGASPQDYADYALQLDDPSTYSRLISQPTEAQAGLAGDAAYYAGKYQYDYSYAQGLDSPSSSFGAAVVHPAVVAAADAAYSTTADLADYSYGYEPSQGPAAFGSVLKQPISAPASAAAAAAAVGSTAEQSAAATLGVATGAAAMQGAMLLPSTRRKLQQHDMLQQQQQQQQDMLVGVMSSQDLQALTAQQQQQPQELQQAYTPMHMSTPLPGALQQQQQQQQDSPAAPLPPLPALFGLANNETLSKFPLYYSDAAVGRLVTGRPFDVVPKFAGAHPPTVRRMAAGLPVQVRMLCLRWLGCWLYNCMLSVV